MNINTLRRNYDKLTVRERFAALVAAAARGDDQECDALLQSAPQRVWRVPDTYGLAQAFHRLSMYHIIRQLEFIGFFLWVVYGGEDGELPDELYDLMDRFAANEAAFVELCRENGIEPDAMYKGLEGSRELIQMLGAVVALGKGQGDPLETKQELEAMRQVLREWS